MHPRTGSATASLHNAGPTKQQASGRLKRPDAHAGQSDRLTSSIPVSVPILIAVSVAIILPMVTAAVVAIIVTVPPKALILILAAFVITAISLAVVTTV